MSAEETVLLRVCYLRGMSNTVAVNDRVYVEGDTLAVPADAVARWLAMGSVELATESTTTLRDHTAPAMQRRTKENTFDHWLNGHSM
ncbi:hypothetical protein ACFRCW_25540 [Streptomyces sp. NPDC056653]|uniref:hypothetical protein n=1 Tax=Streptomyces sp. NPDC056653 TaxID=3345894 RepID=UPI0036810E71